MKKKKKIQRKTPRKWQMQFAYFMTRHVDGNGNGNGNGDGYGGGTKVLHIHPVGGAH